MRTSKANLRFTVVACAAAALLTAGVAGAEGNDGQTIDGKWRDPEAAKPRSTERGIHSLAQELAATARRHGADSVALQAGLLVRTLAAGAVGASEVSVVGASQHAGPSYLEIDVTTGIIFDADSHTRSTHFAHLWREIALPVLEKMESFDTEPRGLELVFMYGLQSFSQHSQRKADPTAPSEQRMLRVAIPEPVLAALVAGTIESDTLLERCTLHDGTQLVAASEVRAD